MSLFCRHCDRKLVMADNGTWMDGDGFCACVKAPLAVPVQGKYLGVLHEPMPAGLRGGPQ
jgi:hypothetical protein